MFRPQWVYEAVSKDVECLSAQTSLRNSEVDLERCGFSEAYRSFGMFCEAYGGAW